MYMYMYMYESPYPCSGIFMHMYVNMYLYVISIYIYIDIYVWLYAYVCIYAVLRIPRHVCVHDVIIACGWRQQPHLGQEGGVAILHGVLLTRVEQHVLCANPLQVRLGQMMMSAWWRRHDDVSKMTSAAWVGTDLESEPIRACLRGRWNVRTRRSWQQQPDVHPKHSVSASD